MYRRGCCVHISATLSLSISFLPVCGLSVSAAAAVVFILSATRPPALTEACDTQALLGSFGGGWAQRLSCVSGVDASKQTVKQQALVQFPFHLRTWSVSHLIDIESRYLTDDWSCYYAILPCGLLSCYSLYVFVWNDRCTSFPHVISDWLKLWIMSHCLCFMRMFISCSINVLLVFTQFWSCVVFCVSRFLSHINTVFCYEICCF